MCYAITIMRLLNETLIIKYLLMIFDCLIENIKNFLKSKRIYYKIKSGLLISEPSHNYFALLSTLCSINETTSNNSFSVLIEDF